MNDDNNTIPRDERASDLRHYLRNRFAAIRNAAFYVECRIGKTSLPDEDPRVKQFLVMIGEQLDQADEAVTEKLTPEYLFGDPE